MNERKQNNKQRSHFLNNLFENLKCFCTQMKFSLQFQRNVSITRLKLLIDAMKTTHHSCLESERLF